MKKGFLFLEYTKSIEKAKEIMNIALSKCDDVVVGIPDEWGYDRIYGEVCEYNPNDVAEEIKKNLGVSDVLIFEPKDIDMQTAYARSGCNVYFTGAEYGKNHRKLVRYAAENNIELISLHNSVQDSNGVSALELALKDVQPWWQMVLVGKKENIDRYMAKFGDKYTPAYVLDSDNLDALKDENVENVFIIICDDDYIRIRDKVLAIGDFDYRLWVNCNPVAVVEEFGISFAAESLYIQKSQAALTRMLRDFDAICREEKIQYYMVFGSLIGAVRHHDFIPWDDDLDIAITRADYDKFKEAFYKKYGLNSNYDLQDLSDWKYDFFQDCSYRIVDTSELYPNKINTNVCEMDKSDIFRRKAIDIYILDSAFDTEYKHKLQTILLKIIYNLAMGHRVKMNYEQYSRLGKTTVCVMKCINGLGKLLPLKWLMRRYVSVCNWANGNDTKDYFMSGDSITRIERRFKKEYFGDGQDIQFADFNVGIPSNVGGVMETLGYGDYMSLPPYKSRKPGHYFNSDIEIW